MMVFVIILGALGLGLLFSFPLWAGPGWRFSRIWRWVKYVGVILLVAIAIGVYLAGWYIVASYEKSLLPFISFVLWHVFFLLLWAKLESLPEDLDFHEVLDWCKSLILLGLLGHFPGVIAFFLAPTIRLGFPIWGGLFVFFLLVFLLFYDKLPKWNVKKGLSGMIFGDSTNFIAVAAGIGSFNILSFNRGLWLLGLLSGFLALAVGLSLHQRWVGQIEEYGKAPADRWITISSELVGLTTILAGLVPKPETVDLIWPYVGIASAIMLMVVGFFWAWRWIRHFRGQDRIGILWLVITCVALVVCLGFIIGFTFTSKAGEPPGVYRDIGNGLGLAAIFFWIVAELFNTWTVTDDFMKGNAPQKITDYLSWEKSVWQIIGALIFMVYSASIALNPTLQNEPIKALFYYGVGLAGIGTIRGIIGGIINQMRKRTGQVPAAPGRSRSAPARLM